MTKAARALVGMVGVVGAMSVRSSAWAYTDCRAGSPSDEQLDNDGDGQCEEATPALSVGCCACVASPCSADGNHDWRYQSGGSSYGTVDADAFNDCNDDVGSVYEGATEKCDDVDNDCDGTIDEDDATGVTDWYEDSDGDGHGNATVSKEACDAPTGYVSSDDDCDDDDDSVYTGATETVGDEVDQNCDGDEECYVDADDDSARSTDTVTSTDLFCDDAGEVDRNAKKDCDDGDDRTYFGAPERCDGKNTDCMDSSGSYDSDPLNNIPPEETDEDSDGYVECCDYGVYTDWGLGVVDLDDSLYAWSSAPTIGEYGYVDYCFPDGVPTALADSGLSGGDCDDAPLTGVGIRPELAYETCECSGTDPSATQRDTDCNGDLNTYLDVWGNVQYTSTAEDAAAAGEPATCSDNYYVDCDADGYAGDKDLYVATPERGPKVLCIATAEEIDLMVSETEAVEFSACEDAATVLSEENANDCNDRDPDAHRGSDEVCNGQDDDCDTKVDEIEDTADEPLGCVQLYLDADKDGQGVKEELGASLCLCDTMGQGSCSVSADYAEGATVVMVDFTSLEFIGLGLGSTEYDDGDGDDTACYVSVRLDCNDTDNAIYKREVSYELLDGKDNDCKSGIPIVELDCDNDGFLTGDVALNAEVSNDLLRLKSCAEVGTLEGNLQCWDGSKLAADDIVCDAESGLWQLPVAYADAAYVDSATSTIVNVLDLDDIGDCDDRCAKRNPDYDEVCDGIDNDCELVKSDAESESATSSDSDGNGVPDAMEETLPGYVSVEELDVDGDGYLACASAGANMSAVSSAISTRSCSDEFDPNYTALAYGDPQDLCARAVPSDEPDDACDGISTYSDDDPMEVDDDGDHHLTCGPAAGENETTESIFLLVYVPETIIADPQSEDIGVGIVPLLEPRHEASGGESETADTEFASNVREVRACDATLSDSLDTLEDLAGLDGSAEVADDRDRLFDICVRAQTCFEEGESTDRPWCNDLYGRCAVVEVTLDSSGNDSILDLLDDVTLADVADALGPECVSEDSYKEDELILRSVWSRDRIVESRRLVVEWECFRLFGTYGCGDLTPPDGEDWISPYYAVDGDQRAQPGGYFESPFVDSQPITSDVRWWKELGRFRVTAATDCLGGCWTVEPLAPYEALDDDGEGFSTSSDDDYGVSRVVGGDCADGSKGKGSNRDRLEGPDDLLGIYFDKRESCDTCLDGLDNNCNGLTDCEDPGCAICFIGQGAGCGGDPDSPCHDATGCSSAAAMPADRWRATGLAAGLIALAGVLIRRRRAP